MRKMLQGMRKEDWTNALQWLGYTVGPGALPFWGLYVLLLLWARQITLIQFLGHGELAVYSAGLVATAIPQLIKAFRGSPFGPPMALFYFAVAHLLLSAVLFAGVTLTALPGLPVLDLDQAVLIKLSLVLLGLGLVIGFLAALLDSYMAGPGILAMQHAGEDALRAQFKKKLGGAHE